MTARVKRWLVNEQGLTRAGVYTLLGATCILIMGLLGLAIAAGISFPRSDSHHPDEQRL